MGPASVSISTLPPGGTSSGVPSAILTLPRSSHRISGWAKSVSMMPGAKVLAPAFQNLALSSPFPFSLASLSAVLPPSSSSPSSGFASTAFGSGGIAPMNQVLACGISSGPQRS